MKRKEKKKYQVKRSVIASFHGKHGTFSLDQSLRSYDYVIVVFNDAKGWNDIIALGSCGNIVI